MSKLYSVLKSTVTQSLTKTLFLCLSFCLVHLQSVAQNNYTPASTGYINFNLGKTILTPSHAQTVSLYGCNTRITIDGSSWHQSDSLYWSTTNQVLDSVPFGPQNHALKDSFYISKYYIAAPPVIKKDKKDKYKTLFNIGKVVPDHFTFDGEKPMQMVYFDYSLFEVMHVKPVHVNFDSSFIKTGIEILPININCKDFPWKDTTNGVMGASGIGDLQHKKSTNFSGLFLPYYYTDTLRKDSIFLNCEITILNDIIPHYKIEFQINGNKKTNNTSINLNQYKNDTITVVCTDFTKKMPCGCIKPKSAIQCE